MTPRFLAAVDFVLQHETEFMRGHDGDYLFAIVENDPDDPGGTTKFGIDQRSHPDVDIKSLTVDRARQIYFASYWGPSHAEQLPPALGEACFDAAVNCGVGQAAIWLQTALANLGFYHAALDGQIGPLTITAATLEQPQATLAAMLDLRRDFYRGLAAQRPSMTKFLKGWLNRVTDLAAFTKPLLA